MTDTGAAEVQEETQKFTACLHWLHTPERDSAVYLLGRQVIMVVQKRNVDFLYSPFVEVKSARGVTDAHQEADEAISYFVGHLRHPV